MMSNQEVQDKLDALGGNAVVYSELAWAAVRKASDGSNIWLADIGASSGGPMNSGEMVSWVDDWEVLRKGNNV